MPTDISLLLSEIAFNTQGLVPVITQDYKTREVLMMAWMNKEALRKTFDTGEMWYYSRSRKSLWHKGETSGQTQTLHTLMIDCDGDTLLAQVEPKGVACHTGRRNCFFRTVTKKGTLKINQKILVAPDKLYKKGN